MNIQDILSDSKWNILKELSKGAKSASELAKKTGQSMPHMTNSLKLLEAKGIVRKVKAKEKTGTGKVSAGKPKTPFELTEEVMISGLLKPGMAERRVSRLRDLHDFERFMLYSAALLEPEQ